MYDVKHHYSDTLQGLILSEPVRQIRVSYATLKVISFVDCGSFIKSFEAVGNNINRLKYQITDMTTIPENKFMKSKLSKVADILPP